MVIVPVTNANTNDYVCAQLNGEWITWSKTPKGTMIPLVRWYSTKIPGWPPRERCIATSERFTALSDNGSLNALVGGVVKSSPVICGVRAQSDPCDSRNVLVTLPQGMNPDAAIRQLLDITSRVSNRTLQLSGTSQSTLESYFNGRTYYNFKAYQSVFEEAEKNNQVSFSQLTPVE